MTQHGRLFNLATEDFANEKLVALKGAGQHSYGFRPGRSAHQAVAAAQGYLREGRGWVVDVDLEKFFDRVNHDKLMYRVRERIADRRVLRLIERYLKAGAMSAGERPWRRRFLGFSFRARRPNRRRVADPALERFKDEVRRLTCRTRGRSLRCVIEELKSYLRGWKAYFGFSEARSVFRELDKWMVRRLRCYLWKQWGGRGYRELRKQGISVNLAWNTSMSAHGPWRLSRSPALSIALPRSYFDAPGLPRLSDDAVAA